MKSLKKKGIRKLSERFYPLPSDLSVKPRISTALKLAMLAHIFIDSASTFQCFPLIA